MTSLNQNGEPTKSRRQGTVKQRHKGSWEIRYYGPADHNGKQKRIQETVRGTKKEAEKILRDRLSAIEDDSHIDKSKQTVSDFIDQWLVTYVATNCTARTASGYQGNIKRYIKPAIGNVAIQILMPSQNPGHLCQYAGTRPKSHHRFACSSSPKGSSGPRC